MKTLQLTTALFFTLLFFASTAVVAQEEEKPNEYHESWPVSEVTTLEISNKYGEVKVKNESGSEVTVDVVITVEAANEKREKEILEKISVDFSKSGGTVRAVTKIDGTLRGQHKLDIDYEVNIPSDKNLKISNKYGNTIVSKLEADGIFVTKYGNFTANTLATPEGGELKVDLAYGNANIGAATNMDLEVSYSPVTIGEMKNLEVNSKYSTITIEEAGNVSIASKYDKYNFEEVRSVAANMKYTHLRIEELAQSLKLESGYGGVKVGEVAPGFEFIDITSSYGRISLGLDNASYEVDAQCHYCGISYPEDDFTGDRIKENNSRTIKGKVGGGEGGKVTLRSRYGDIKLRD